MPKHDKNTGSTPYPEAKPGRDEGPAITGNQPKGPITHGTPGSGKGVDVKPQNPI